MWKHCNNNANATTITKTTSVRQQSRVFIVLLLSRMNSLLVLWCCCCLLLLPSEYLNTSWKHLPSSVLPRTTSNNDRILSNRHYQHHRSIHNNENDVVASATTTTRTTSLSDVESGTAIILSDAIRIVQEHGYYVCSTTTTTTINPTVLNTRRRTTITTRNNNESDGRTSNNSNNYDVVFYDEKKERIYCSLFLSKKKDQQQNPEHQQQPTIEKTRILSLPLPPHHLHQHIPVDDEQEQQQKQQPQQQQRRMLLRSKNHPLSERILLDDSNNSTSSSTETTTTTTDTTTLDNTAAKITDNDIEKEIEKGWIILTNCIGVLCCVIVAAIAAGLTVGMLGLDPLMLLIKERASTDPTERIMAQKLLPIIKQRHLLLVTLLIMNSIANETMPIFLEKVVHPAIAIMISVTLVLFVGEIIPSAIFTGPNQIQLASYMIPLVKFVMFILYPIAKPIASLLDIVLSGGGGGGSCKKRNANGTTEDLANSIRSDFGEGGNQHHDEGFSIYDRQELAALIRIQYEERVANKRRLKMERQNVHEPYHTLSERNYIPDAAAIHHSIRNNIESLSQSNNETSTLISTTGTKPVVSSDVATSSSTGIIQTGDNIVTSSTVTENGPDEWRNIHQHIAESIEHIRLSRRDSEIELDEVMMVEGALQMRTKCAFDVFTPLRHVYALPASMILNHKNMVAIYASGYSRIPVYDDTVVDSDSESTNATGTKKRKYPQSAIIGILVTKVLIVVNPKDKRTVGSLPLRTPQCVSPGTSLVDLIHMFQTGGPKGGHQALVCTSPSIGNRALAKPGQCLPEKAGLIGIVTFEDVLEMLLQEEIYDEMDKEQRAGQRLAEMVCRRWKVYTERKKLTTSEQTTVTNSNQSTTTAKTPIPQRVTPTITTPPGGNEIVTETTALLGVSTANY